MEGVNKPELLPKDFTTVIDVAGFLTPGEVGGPSRCRMHTPNARAHQFLAVLLRMLVRTDLKSCINDLDNVLTGICCRRADSRRRWRVLSATQASSSGC